MRSITISANSRLPIVQSMPLTFIGSLDYKQKHRPTTRSACTIQNIMPDGLIRLSSH